MGAGLNRPHLVHLFSISSSGCLNTELPDRISSPECQRSSLHPRDLLSKVFSSYTMLLLSGVGDPCLSETDLSFSLRSSEKKFPAPKGPHPADVCSSRASANISDGLTFLEKTPIYGQNV
ncbi:hypothetical protein AMECASPLE_032355 [Ameca splendens]|uniref:Uncharacterized protein n=1 Tax=Ameca splendens TaxID=208324 RepID=A0ABV1A2D2_9TELE